SSGPVGAGMADGASAGLLADTWIFDGMAWSQAQTRAPPGRYAGSMTYDPATRGLVLFGGAGCGTASYCGDTWLFDGTHWSPVTASPAPAARAHAALVFDPVIGRLVLFGGTGSCSSTSDCGDTWTFDGKHWTQVTSSPSPPARDSASMVYDAATR